MSEDAPAAKRLARAGSFSGVWWKLGDAAVDPSVTERRLRSIADEEGDLRARIATRQARARVVRRRIACASLAVEVGLSVFSILWCHQSSSSCLTCDRSSYLLSIHPCNL
jgi:hypothetical protein